MTNPQPYNVSYNFGGFQANNPTTPLPAPQLDNELANIAVAVRTVVAAIEDIRRTDGALNNGIVTFDSLEAGLQFTFDPTNGQLVAAAVATAQAAAVSASGFNTSAGVHDTNAAASATAAAASASSVNLSLYLAKANNLAGLGSNTTALANIGAADVAGNTATGRWAPQSGANCEDFNTGLASGWYAGDTSAVNTPVAATAFLLEVTAFSALFVSQKAYPFMAAAVAGVTSSVMPYRRYSYDSGGGVLAWTPWESASPMPVGSTIWINATSAPPGFIKENGALISRATYPALTTFALASGNIVSEATWSGGSTGAFSTGDLSTTIRIPDARGEFIRGFDDSRGIDSGRVIGAHQAQDVQPHTHTYTAPSYQSGGPTGSGGPPNTVGGATLSTGSAGTTETRPRNNAKLACIKY